MNGSGSNLHQLTPSANDDDYWGVWSPDGKKIAFDRTSASGFGDIWTMNADGSSQKRLTESPRRQLRLGLVARRQADRVHVQPDGRLRDLRDALRGRAADPALPLGHGRGAPASRAGRRTARKIVFQEQVNGHYEIFVIDARTAAGSGS